MSIKYGKIKHKTSYVLNTIFTSFLLLIVFIFLTGYVGDKAKNDAHETLHLQTKQVKDDIILQLTSDRENLATMANFAAKLHSDGESYDLMFESFKPIGLIENIGILNPDNTFVTKAGSINLDGKISFEEESKKGAYISERVDDLTLEGNELIRSAVPIKVKDETVGILYGVIKLEKIGARYKNMVKELNAQLFVYDKDSQKLIIDTIHDELGSITFLETRKFEDGYSYEQFVNSERGTVVFESAYIPDQSLHLHYSPIEGFNWMIAMGRYDDQVYAHSNDLIAKMAIAAFIMAVIVILYILKITANEKKVNAVTNCAAEVRKSLLETVDGHNNIFDALVLVCKFAKSRSAVFFDTNGDDYKYVLTKYESKALLKNDRHYFKTELFRYAAELYNANHKTVNVMCIKPRLHLYRTNPSFYKFLQLHKITDISFAAVVNNTNHITILGTVNAKHSKLSRSLAEKVAACFSMALYNKNHINKTEIAATTDSLTGILNRVSYNKDFEAFDLEQPTDFSCVYIDVNELHICNNKYGHAAGDEMLMYIANALKENFNGHKLYRIGGDEFLVFAKNTEEEVIKANVESFLNQLALRNYHVALGVSYRAQSTDTTEVVKEAELKMYEEKSLYYQNKEKQNTAILASEEFVQIKTGILEIDTILSILNEKYNGIYRVSLDSDTARRILMPAYLNYNENEEHFTNLVSKYISESVDPDYHRVLTSFLNYDVIKRQLSEGVVPKIRYKKTNGNAVVLSVYKLGESGESVSDTLWVFAKE